MVGALCAFAACSSGAEQVVVAVAFVHIGSLGKAAHELHLLCARFYAQAVVGKFNHVNAVVASPDKVFLAVVLDVELVD